VIEQTHTHKLWFSIFVETLSIYNFFLYCKISIFCPSKTNPSHIDTLTLPLKLTWPQNKPMTRPLNQPSTNTHTHTHTNPAPKTNPNPIHHINTLTLNQTITHTHTNPTPKPTNHTHTNPKPTHHTKLSHKRNTFCIMYKLVSKFPMSLCAFRFKSPPG